MRYNGFVKELTYMGHVTACIAELLSLAWVIIRHTPMVAIKGTTKPIPSHVDRSLKLIWRSGTPLLKRLPLCLAWISNYINHKMWDEITYPFSNQWCAAIEVWEWICNFIPHFYWVCDNLSMLELKIKPCYWKGSQLIWNLLVCSLSEQCWLDQCGRVFV